MSRWKVFWPNAYRKNKLSGNKFGQIESKSQTFDQPFFKLKDGPRIELLKTFFTKVNDAIICMYSNEREQSQNKMK